MGVCMRVCERGKERKRKRERDRVRELENKTVSERKRFCELKGMTKKVKKFVSVSACV